MFSLVVGFLASWLLSWRAVFWCGFATLAVLGLVELAAADAPALAYVGPVSFAQGDLTRAAIWPNEVKP